MTLLRSAVQHQREFADAGLTGASEPDAPAWVNFSVRSARVAPRGNTDRRLPGYSGATAVAEISTSAPFFGRPATWIVARAGGAFLKNAA